MTSLVFSPLVPWPWLFALCGLVALTGILRPARWRILLAVVILAALSGPQVEHKKLKPQKDIVVVVRDNSRSDQTADRKATADRLYSTLKRRLASLEGIRTITLDTTDTTDTGSDLFDQIAPRLDALPPGQLSSIIAITDGDLTEVPVKLARNVPVHVLLTDQPQRYDRRLVLKAAPAYALVGKPQSLTLVVEDSRSASVPLTLKIPGQAEETHTITTNQPVTIPFTINHPGPGAVVLSVPVAPGELTAVNNRAVTLLTGVRETLNVLLISGAPHNGTMVIRNLLKSDPGISLVHFTILRSLGSFDPTPENDLALIPFPVRQLFSDRLSHFDLVIFDHDIQPGFIDNSYFDNLVNYVKNGGAMLVLAGSDFNTPVGLSGTPLSAILPVVPTGRVQKPTFRPTLTAIGKRHPVTSPFVGQDKTWGRMEEINPTRVRSGRTLLAGPGSLPLLTISPEGKGRVGIWLSDQWWLWARGIDGGGPATEMLRRVTHWLMKEPELEENRLFANLDGNTLKLHFTSVDRTTPLDVTLTYPRGKQQTVTLNTQNDYTATEQVDENGLYTATTQAGQVAYAVRGQVRDMEWQAPSGYPALKALADKTGGGIYLPTDSVPTVRRVGATSTAHGPGWLGIPERGQAEVVGTTTVPLLPAWLVWLIIATGCVLVWGAEAKKRLLR